MNYYAYRTGKTTAMLQRALTYFLAGNDVIITAYSHTYAKDLMLESMNILSSNRVPHTVHIQALKLFVEGKWVMFTKHEDEHNTHKFRGLKARVYSDHYRG